MDNIASSQSDLIFDFGMHKGFDAEFYLKKGFRVVGLEAAPGLAETVKSRLHSHIVSGKLVIENRALYNVDGEMVEFFTVPDKDDWGSLHRNAAGKGVYESIPISVPTVTLTSLFDRYGVPYYIKCDMEGADTIFRDQLLSEERRPIFVSIEVNELDDAEVLRACGYDVFQIVNQWMHPFTRCPDPPREGVFVEATFDGETSGLFGHELAADRWIEVDEASERIELYRRLKALDDNLAPGWIDLHATRRSALLAH